MDEITQQEQEWLDKIFYIAGQGQLIEVPVWMDIRRASDLLNEKFKKIYCYIPPTEKDMASEKYKKAQEIGEMEKKSHVLHLKCNKCGNTDLVFSEKAKLWTCAFCDYNLIYIPPSQTDKSSEKYKKAQEICDKEFVISPDDFEKDVNPNNIGLPWPRKGISKEEAKEMFPENPLSPI